METSPCRGYRSRVPAGRKWARLVSLPRKLQTAGGKKAERDSPATRGPWRPHFQDSSALWVAGEAQAFQGGQGPGQRPGGGGQVPRGTCTGFQAPMGLWAPTSATPCGPAGQSPDPAARLPEVSTGSE